MSFQHKKVSYINLFRWHEMYPDANCFYCQKTCDLGELGYKFLDTVGICKECMEDFEIGHLAADRYVVQNILGEKMFTTKEQIVAWFQEKGHVLEKTDDGENFSGYNFINDDGSTTRIEISDSGLIHIIY